MFIQDPDAWRCTDPSGSCELGEHLYVIEIDAESQEAADIEVQDTAGERFHVLSAYVHRPGVITLEELMSA